MRIHLVEWAAAGCNVDGRSRLSRLSLSLGAALLAEIPALLRRALPDALATRASNALWSPVLRCSARLPLRTWAAQGRTRAHVSSLAPCAR